MFVIADFGLKSFKYQPVKEKFKGSKDNKMVTIKAIKITRIHEVMM